MCTRTCMLRACPSYLIEYVRELPEFAELYKVEPSHVKDPFGCFLWAGFQVKRRPACRRTRGHTHTLVNIKWWEENKAIEEKHQLWIIPGMYISTTLGSVDYGVSLCAAGCSWQMVKRHAEHSRLTLTACLACSGFNNSKALLCLCQRLTLINLVCVMSWQADTTKSASQLNLIRIRFNYS